MPDFVEGLRDIKEVSAFTLFVLSCVSRGLATG
jgi:hypothetical protein